MPHVRCHTVGRAEEESLLRTRPDVTEPAREHAEDLLGGVVSVGFRDAVEAKRAPHDAKVGVDEPSQARVWSLSPQCSTAGALFVGRKGARKGGDFIGRHERRTL